jgi:hypothetical protein
MLSYARPRLLRFVALLAGARARRIRRPEARGGVLESSLTVPSELTTLSRQAAGTYPSYDPDRSPNALTFRKWWRSPFA